VGASFFFPRWAYGVGGFTPNLEEVPEEERMQGPTFSQETQDERPGGPISYGDYDTPDNLIMDQDQHRMPDVEGTVTLRSAAPVSIPMAKRVALPTRGWESRLHPERLAIANLRAWQPDVGDGPSVTDEPIHVWRQPSGELVIADGHHRVEAAIARGQSTIEAMVYDGPFQDLFASPSFLFKDKKPGMEQDAERGFNLKELDRGRIDGPMGPYDDWANNAYTDDNQYESGAGSIHLGGFGVEDLPRNADGTVTLYHGTTAEGARQIVETGTLQSAGEPDVYLTTAKTGTGYGDGTVVAVDVDPDSLELDDEFPDGRRDYKVSAPGKRFRVSNPRLAAMLQAPPAMFEAAKTMLDQALRYFMRKRLAERAHFRANLPRELEQVRAEIGTIDEQIAALTSGQTIEIPLPKTGRAASTKAIRIWRRPSYASNPDKFHVLMVVNGDVEPFEIKDAVDLPTAQQKARRQLGNSLSNAERASEGAEEDAQDDAELMTKLGNDDPPQINESERGVGAVYQLETDLTGWRYENVVDPSKVPPVVTFVIYDWKGETRGIWRGSDHMALYVDYLIATPESLARTRRDFEGIIEHELAHGSQSFIEKGRDLKGPAGVPSRGRDKEPFNYWREDQDLEHAERAVEFYPNLISELHDFRNSMTQNQVPQAEWPARARAWVESRPRFKTVKNFDENRWRKMVTEFMRATANSRKAAGALPHYWRVQPDLPLIGWTTRDHTKARQCEFCDGAGYLNEDAEPAASDDVDAYPCSECDGAGVRPIKVPEGSVMAYDRPDFQYRSDRNVEADWVVVEFEGEDAEPSGDIEGVTVIPVREVSRTPVTQWPSLRRRFFRDAQQQGQRQPWVAVDLDDTLLEHEEGMAERGEFGKPLPGAVKAMRELKSLGWRISIFTARIGDDPNEAAALAQQIGQAVANMGIPFDDVWIGSKPRADYFVDNKAIRFNGDWDSVLLQLTETGGDEPVEGADQIVDDAAEEASEVARGATTGLIDTVYGENEFDDQGYTRHDISVARPPDRREWF
jgi:hypothetical protein